MTRSKGPAEELSLPPTRMRKDVSTANEGEENAQGQVQANEQNQSTTADVPLPFARPGSRAGTCTTPASDGGMLPKASNPFTRPDSRAGFAPTEPTSPQSSVSSTSDNQLQEDVNTSVSWDLVDTDTDAEVASINIRQNNAVNLNDEINTLHNQDFFVADTTGRRLSQVADKSNYSSLLPNGNAVLQLRLPDLLIYLKTDTYLVDVKTGHHYAVYHNRIEKMSVLPKLYSAWPYRQLLQAIHDDAVRFGVNLPEPATSEQSAPVAQPSSSIDREVRTAKKQQPSPCMPTIVNYEPPSFNLQIPKKMFTRSERDQVLRNHMTAANTTFNKVAVLEDLMRQEPHNAAHYKDVQHVQKNQHIQVAVKLQHMLEADNEFRQAAGLPQLDLPEHLWTVRNMDTDSVREQHFMAISSEVEVLRQQLKVKGMYPAPPNYMQINQQNVHFQPIQPAKLSPLQHQDRLFFDPLLSTTTGSTGSQSDSTHNPTQDCSSAPPKVHTPSPRIPEPTILPTPYVNQTAVEQHMRMQSPSVPPTNITRVAPPPREPPQASVAQEPLITLATLQTTPPQAQNQLTTSPQQPRTSKSKDGRGIKQSKNVNATDITQVCWRCSEPGHKKRDCRKKATSSTSHYGSPKQRTANNNVASGQVRSQVTPQVSPLAQVNSLAQPTRSNSFPPPPYFPIPFPPPPVPPSNASIAPSAPASDLSVAISLMTNAVNQGNANTTNITDTLQRTTTQFADALQKTIQRGVEAQAEENRNARLDKQFDKIKIFDGSNPAECHPWLEEVHALCSQTGRPFKEMLLLCAEQAV